MLERMQGKLGEQHAGELRRDSAAARAERIIGERTGALGLKPSRTGGWAQERSGQNGARGAAAPGDDADDQSDCVPSAPGDFQECQRPAARLPGWMRSQKEAKTETVAQ